MGFWGVLGGDFWMGFCCAKNPEVSTHHIEKSIWLKRAGLGFNAPATHMVRLGAADVVLVEHERRADSFSGQLTFGEAKNEVSK